MLNLIDSAVAYVRAWLTGHTRPRVGRHRRRAEG